MKKRNSATLNKAKKKVGKVSVQHTTGTSLTKRPESALSISTVTFCVRIEHNPVLEGIGSLGNVSGGYVRFDRYMRGNYVSDLRRDWERVGRCLSESMKAFR